jgi:lipoate-protein ligase A
MLFAEWRLVLTGPADAYVNMAIDEATLILVGEERVPPTLRIYQWNEPCCTVGFLQDVSDVASALHERKLMCVRRLSGGEACLHGGDLSYTVAVSLLDTLIPNNVVSSYERISAGVIEGLRLLGVESQFAAPADVHISKSAVATAAQARRQGVLLHQGTIALGRREVEAVPALPCRTLMPLSELLGEEIDMDAAAEALSMGFRRALGVDLARSVLFAKEKRLARQLLRVKYAQSEWTFSQPNPTGFRPRREESSQGGMPDGQIR